MHVINLGDVHTSELGRPEIDLSPAKAERKRSNVN